MRGKQSFRIESKRFDLVLGEKGLNPVKFTEIRKHHRCDIFTGREGAIWLGRCVEENITRESEQAFIRTRGEHNRTYIIRRYSNHHGRYVEVTECGRGESRGRIIIPEGSKQNGWRGFVKELKLLLSPEQGPITGITQGDAKPMIASRDESKITRGERKSYVETVGGSEHERTLTAKPVIRALELRKEIVTENSGPPKIVAQSKIREPLRFFPNLAPLAENRFVKGGLTINVNDKGQRKVSWTPREDNAKLKWVPRGPGPGFGNDTSTNEAVWNSRAQVTLEVGESSKTIIEEAQVNTTKPTKMSPERGCQVEANSGDFIDPIVYIQPDKPEPLPIADISQNEVLEKPEKVREDVQVVLSTRIDWSLIFKDGRRMVIPDFCASPWDSARVSSNLNSEVLVMPIAGGLAHGNASEGGRENSLARVPGTIVVFVEDNTDTLEITHLAIDFSMQEEEAGSRGDMEQVAITQQQLSEWIMGHLKKIGKALGASYEGNEEIVIGLLQTIEACRAQKGHSEVLIKRGRPSATKGQRELKGLVSSVNYEPRTPESRRSFRERALLITQ